MILTSVLLDVFGTLLDDATDEYFSPFSHLLLPLGLDAQQLARANHLILTSPLPTVEDAADQLQALFPGRPIPVANRQMAAAELDRHLRCIKLVDGVSQWLPRLRRAGLKVVLVSNLAAPYQPLIARHRLDQLVDATVYSFEVGFRKPEPQIFELALGRIGAAASATVMIGDNEIDDCQAARSLGIQSRLVMPGCQDGGASLKRALNWVLSVAEAASQERDAVPDTNGPAKRPR